MTESMIRYIGQTVTVFTESGGLSGSGFTGVLAGICDGCIKLISDIGAPPACPLGNACCGGYLDGRVDGECGCGRRGCDRRCGWRGRGYGYGNWGYNWLGSVTEIPIRKIVSFTHNAI
jgi:hypothetical protein